MQARVCVFKNRFANRYRLDLLSWWWSSLNLLQLNAWLQRLTQEETENDPWNRFWQSQKNAKYNNNFYGVFMLIQTATVMSKVPEYCDIPLFLTLLETFYTKTYHAGIRRFLVMVEVTVSEIWWYSMFGEELINNNVWHLKETQRWTFYIYMIKSITNAPAINLRGV